MSDTIARIGDTIVQQGRHNDRIYVMKLAMHDVPGIIDRLKEIALENGYSKIFIKAPESGLNHFKTKGYTIEAVIPGFYRGKEDGYFLARYLKDSRKKEPKKDQLQQVLKKAVILAGFRRPISLEPDLSFRIAGKDDAGELAKLYKQVFATYPFPIFDEAYLKKTMEENIRYFCVSCKDTIIAASSAEMDREMKNVEMTDFATHPDYRGKKISGYLLHRMEEDMLKEGMKISYTIARAFSYPINTVFSRAGYTYSGTLVNNTNICGSFESMNVWYKPLVKKTL
ncbi:putative beta-lysine N-acetyltransferase [Methanocella sp. MCL-LM]|uniref:putative beta-lysine N-acetyltransferase n=1 Tax=Methanocella sp. MCL-LM TaxID=3412035 RepID=UPI003C75DDE3